MPNSSTIYGPTRGWTAMTSVEQLLAQYGRKLVDQWTLAGHRAWAKRQSAKQEGALLLRKTKSALKELNADKYAELKRKLKNMQK
jgi:hypothetical protein